MKILMVTSEALPFAKAGGLADAVSSLSATLSGAGHEVRIVMPLYKNIPRKDLKKVDGPLGIDVGWNEEWASVYRSTLPGAQAEIYFLEHERYFGREGIYGSAAEPDYDDNPQRFAFLSRGALALCDKLDWTPDIVHAHDWPTGLVPVYLKAGNAGKRFVKAKSILSIHNLGYQGVYSKEVFPFFRLPWEEFHGSGFEYYDRINLLKAGIAKADKICTVSPTYAREIQTPEAGCGMDGLLRHRSKDLIGILNGIDGEAWDPAKDSLIPAPYSMKKMSGKKVCRAALAKEFGIDEDPEVPFIGMIARLTEQKGTKELFGPGYGSVPAICADMAVRFVIIGTGEKWCEDEIRGLSRKLPNFKGRIGYDERIAHLIEAGSDFYMMPSRYEPCGLNQMYSLRYGTIPIARRTGGLADTIENYEEESGTGTGFLFNDLTPRSIYDTTGWAVWAFYNKKDHIKAMRERGMSQDFSWTNSAREYETLYREALKEAD